MLNDVKEIIRLQNELKEKHQIIGIKDNEVQVFGGLKALERLELDNLIKIYERSDSDYSYRAVVDVDGIKFFSLVEEGELDGTSCDKTS